MYKIIIFLWIPFVLKVNSVPIEDISEYFDSDVFMAFQKNWQAHRKSFENAIGLALKENFGYRGLNVYVRKPDDSLRICDGFYLNDNVVEVLFLDMTLSSLPRLSMPEVTFALASNVLRVEAGLGKMVIETRYLLFRNDSEIVNSADQDPYKHSPFSYQQVEDIGRLAIIADDCTLLGYTLTKLHGHSINLGHDTFQVNNCKFSVEISPYVFGWPPVIAPYFSRDQGKQLEIILTKPIREELIPKLQAAVYTYINTSVIFGAYLPKYREYQNNIFKSAKKNMTQIVRKILNNTREIQEESVKLAPVGVLWTVTCNVELCWKHILIDNVTLYGLDTLYSSHSGGPYKLQSPKIAETFRFNTIMVRGNIFFQNNTYKRNHNFVIELKDFSVNVEQDLKNTKPIFKATTWRTMGLSVMKFEHNIIDRHASSAFINGYIVNKLPDYLIHHLSDMYHDTKNTTNVKLNDYIQIDCKKNMTDAVAQKPLSWID